MFNATVSIDLGAAYTKVSYRETCEPGKVGLRLEEARVLTIDGSSLIPSLAIQTKRKSHPWVFGWEAAKLNPDATMKVFRNWKADLFRPANDKESAAAVIVAEHFLGWLKDQLEAAGIDLENTHTRVAMPAFKAFEEKALVVALCMEMNGWPSPLILKATEPHANALGLFTRGRSVVTQSRTGTLFLDHPSMFGHGNELIRTAREFVLLDRGSNLVRTMIVDIGAFTTDLALLTFDVNAPGDGLEKIEQESHEVGVINELDQPLLAALAKAHEFDWSDVRFEESELAKQDLYEFKNYTLLLKPKRTILLGEDDADVRLIRKHLDAFEEAVWEKILTFIKNEAPTTVYFTGGGSLIASVTKGLKGRLVHRKIRCATLDPAGLASGTAQWRNWEKTGLGLHRIATALGGTSAVLQANPKSLHAGVGTISERKPPAPPGPRFTTCRCQGGNKDCCFCSGVGYYTKR